MIRFKRDDGLDYPSWGTKELLKLLSQPITDGPHETPDLAETGIPFISVDAIVNNRIDFNRKRGFITKEFNDYCNKKYVPKRNDVYLVKAGATVGKVAIVETDEVFNIWSPLAAMRTNKENSPYFLYYLLQTEALQKEIQIKSFGGNQPNLGMRDLERFKITTPCLEEQQKIADFLSSVDEVIKESENEVKALEELKKGAMQKIFNREVRFTADGGSEYPAWKTKTLEDTCECLDFKRKPVSKEQRIPGPYPYYGSTNIQDYVDGYLFDEPLVLLAEDAGPFDDYLNKAIAQWADGKYWVNNHAHVLRPKECRKFMFYALEHKDIRAFINNPGRGKLNQEDMNKIVVHMPCLEEQQKIADFLSDIDTAIQESKKELEQWKLLKKGLLQQIFE